LNSGHALMHVIDDTNLTQNILNTLSTIQQYFQKVNQLAKQDTQIGNEVTQIRHQLSQLETMYRNLKRLSIILQDPMLSNLEKCEAVYQNSQRLKYTITAIQKDFEKYYPHYSAADTDTLKKDNQGWTEATKESVQKSMEAQGSVEYLPQDRQDLGVALQKSRDAVGNLQATQAGNEIAANMSKQLMRLEHVVAANGRAVSAKLAEENAIKRAREAHHEHFFRDYGTKSTATPLTDLP
jgi:P-type conjugative transfer protein TrbJ